MEEPPEDRASTLGEEMLAGVVGAAIAVGCIAPPIVHLVTGPLGPFIGGFVAANRVKASPRASAIIAVCIGTGASGLIATAAHLAVVFVGRSELPTWFPSPQTVVAIVAGAFLYATALGAVGATVRASLAQKKENAA